MFNSDKPEVVQNGCGVSGDLRTDSRTLVEGIGGAAAAVGLDDELNSSLSVNVNYTVCISAENESAMHVIGTVHVAGTLRRIITPNGSVCSERGSSGEGNGVG